MLQIDNSQSQTIDQFLDRLDKLHSSPTVALRVLELTRDPDFEMIEMVGCLEHDPALAASILRLVNSSYYGLSQEVTSLQHALAYLGRRSLRLTVLSFGLVKSFVSGAPAQFHQAYWKRSLTMAAAARTCAEMAGELDADSAFAAGLLADLGMLAVAQLETDVYMQLPAESDHLVELVEWEREALGFDHMAVTQRLLSRWQLPESLIEAVANHHTYLPGAPRLNQLLITANLLSEVLWTPNSPYMQPLQLILSRQFDLDVDDLITLSLRCKETVNKSIEIFSVQLDDHIDLEAIEQQARQQIELASLDTTSDQAILEAITAKVIVPAGSSSGD